VINRNATRHIVADGNAGRLIILEGRDCAGKTSAARYLGERFAGRVVSLGPPGERDRRFYFDRWLEQLPRARQTVIWDRSWYNRAGVERVMGFASPLEVEVFLRVVPHVEGSLVATGMVVVKIYMSISKSTQVRRLAGRGGAASQLDRSAVERWDAYTRAEEEMLRRTSTARAPWIVIDAEDMPRSRRLAARAVARAARSGQRGEAA
jgi:polyphosphate kinase 2 (PPK2 family)